MEITHDILLSLGFAAIPNRKACYDYKDVAGQLTDTGLFFFYGFTPAISAVSDLKYILMLIDFRWEATILTYSGHDN